MPLNLPCTMTPEEAADCVLDFEPTVINPYHCLGSEVEKFRSAIEASNKIEVRLLE